MATLNPLSLIDVVERNSISKQVFCISGIMTTVYGIEEVPPAASTVACLWLLHPSLKTQECMQPLAAAAITRWNDELGSLNEPEQVGFIAVSFDQRNHGTREVSPLANQSWRNGNPRHGLDLYSIYRMFLSTTIPGVVFCYSWLKLPDGTARDTSLLLDHLPSSLFPLSERSIVSHIVLGVSLGGHAAWHCIVHEARFKAAIVVIGCPDYVQLMRHRAAKSKLQTWTGTSPPGASFIGSRDFPTSLLEVVQQSDPAALLMGHTTPSVEGDLGQLNLTQQKLGGKRILNLSGGADKLVPHSCTQQFFNFLQRKTVEGLELELKDMVFAEVGHEMSSGMFKEALRFILAELRNSSARKAAAL